MHIRSASENQPLNKVHLRIGNARQALPVFIVLSRSIVINSDPLVFPMFALVLLTFSVLFRLFRLRSKLVADGKIDPAYFSVYQGEQEPTASAQLSRHFTNLYEAPVLFYVCCLAAIATKATGLAFLLLAWCYVGARAIHTFIHTGRNDLWPRIYAYFSSWIILLAMWLLLVVRVAGVS